MSVATLASQALVELAVNSEPLSEQSVVGMGARSRSTHRAELGFDQLPGASIPTVAIGPFAATQRSKPRSGRVLRGQVNSDDAVCEHVGLWARRQGLTRLAARKYDRAKFSVCSIC